MNAIKKHKCQSHHADVKKPSNEVSEDMILFK